MSRSNFSAALNILVFFISSQVYFNLRWIITVITIIIMVVLRLYSITISFYLNHSIYQFKQRQVVNFSAIATEVVSINEKGLNKC